jgi:hypothetical protein
MPNVLKKNWLHLAIWSLMFIYLLAAPGVYTRNVLSNGKPIEFSQALPATTDQIRASVDRLDPMASNGQDIYNLWGWAFYLGDADQAAYDRLIVLQSDDRTYYFPTESFKRPDLQLAFPDVSMDIRETGFSAYISNDVLHPGKYQVGILFEPRKGGDNYYNLSNKILVSTPNTLALEALSASEVTTGSSASSKQAIENDQSLPVPDGQIKYSVDRLDLLSSNNSSTLYNLWGWAFFLGDPDQAKYERYIVLQSETKTIMFLTQSFERLSVPNAFPNLNMDLRNSGFSTDISTSEVPEGIYRVGILFVDTATDSRHFTQANKDIVSASNQLQLVIPSQQP